VPGI
jgi:hypothetical protein